MNFNTKPTTDFFNTEYCNYASYDNIRKIPSLVDGQKNAARKILWYIFQKNINTPAKEVKVSQLDSKVAEATEYLHGSMAGVIVNLAQDYVGTNNINLLDPSGNFGTNLVPESSAARYIYTFGTPDMFNIFNHEDANILEHQEFEGHKIEPKFMLPKLPLLLINGSEGISSGYASKILPRNPLEIQKYIEYYLLHPNAPKKPFNNKPFYRNFKGTIVQGDEKHKWEILGTFIRNTNGTVKITELPVGTNLKQYIKTLEKLEDDKIIISYKDNTTEQFDFDVKFNRKALKEISDEKLIQILKLRKKVSENYTVVDQFNKVQVFNNVAELMDAYVAVKREYIQKRKDDLIHVISQDIRVDVSKYVFIKSIIDQKLAINNRPIADVEKDISLIDKIIQRDDSYDYLLNMSVRTLTKERMQKLLQDIKNRKAQLDKVRKSSIEDMWISDLK